MRRPTKGGAFEFFSRFNTKKHFTPSLLYHILREMGVLFQ